VGESPIAALNDNNRRILLIAVFVIVFAVLFFGFKSCSSRGPADDGYITIYSNMSLKDSSAVVAQLKTIKIAYKIRENGQAIAVPREKADEARLGLAEKNLPTGGSVGWEIFDESKLGTTDFDRRVQFARAISGELSRTIARLEAVLDARVQIVMPQTQLFEVAKIPVTASVLLQLKSGHLLTKYQINGIVRLVASSVENLRPENVTIVDIYGNVLSDLEEGDLKALSQSTSQTLAAQPVVKEAVDISKGTDKTEKSIESSSKEVNLSAPTIIEQTKEVTLVQIPSASLEAEKLPLTPLEIKEEYENFMAKKAQTMLNKFYPPNSILVKINVDFANIKLKKIKRMDVVILVDNRFNMTTSTKKATYKTIAGVLPYNAKRGDKIILNQVPFQHVVSNSKALPPGSFAPKKDKYLFVKMIGYAFGDKILNIVFIGFLVIVAIFVTLRVLRRKEETLEEKGTKETEPNSPIDDLRAQVSRSPEKAAEVLKKWLSEDDEEK